MTASSEADRAILLGALCIDDVCFSLNGCGCYKYILTYGDEREAAGVARGRDALRDWRSQLIFADEGTESAVDSYWRSVIRTFDRILDAIPDHRPDPSPTEGDAT